MSKVQAPSTVSGIGALIMIFIKLPTVLTRVLEGENVSLMEKIHNLLDGLTWVFSRYIMFTSCLNML